MNTLVLTAAPRAPIAKRAALVLALWLGFWLLALGLVAALLWIPLAQMVYRGGPGLEGWVAGLAGLTLAYALRPRWRERDIVSATPGLAREAAPALYALVERIGAELGIVAPVNIHLASAATAYIFGKRTWYGKISSLEVALGLPLVGSMSEAELGSVIAHEFGHFVAGDMTLGPWVYRTRIAIARTVGDLDNSLFFLDILFRAYGQWFLRLSASVSRAQEYAADATAAKAFGTASACNALSKVHLVEPAWSSYFQLELLPALGRGARPPIFEGFRRFCAASVRRPEVQEAIRHAETQPVSEFDSHPTLDERLAALAPGVATRMPPPSDCFALFGGELATEQAWYARFVDDEGRACDWSRYGQDVLQPQLAERFADTWMDPKVLALSELRALASNLDELWPRVRPPGVSFLSRMGKRREATEVLLDWVIACLTARGFIAMLDPGQALRMERDGQRVLPASLLDAALAGTLDSATLAALELPA